VNVNVTVERDSFGNITRGDPFFGLGTYPGLSGELNVGAINQNFSSEKTVSGGGMQIGDAGNASTSSPGSGGDSMPLPPLPPPPPPQILEDSKGIDVTRIVFALCLLIALGVSGWLLYKNYSSGTTNNTKNNTKNNNNNAQRNNAAAAANNVPDDFDFDPIPEDAPLPNAANVPEGSNDFDFETGDTFPNNNTGRRGNNAAAS
jgi:hypothetical protein